MNLKSVALGFVTLSLSTVVPVQSSDSPQAQLEGVKCWIERGPTGPPLLVCVIEDDAEPYSPDPGFDLQSRTEQDLLLPLLLTTIDDLALQPWLTAQPSEPPQTQPHTP